MPLPAQDLPVKYAVRVAKCLRCKGSGSSNTAPNALSCHSFSSYSVWHGTCECLVIPQAFVKRTGRNHGLSTPGTPRESGCGSGQRIHQTEDREHVEARESQHPGSTRTEDHHPRTGEDRYEQ